MKKLNLTICLLIVVLTIFMFDATMSFARYKSSVDSLMTIDVAKPILSITSEEITETINPINSIIMPFTISNYENTEITYLKLKYYLTFSMKEKKFPIIFELYEVDENNNLTQIPLNDNKTDYFTIDKETLSNHKYYLKIFWDKNDISYKYQNLNDYVKINVYVEQV